MSVSIYHFPTPNGFVSVVGSTNLSPGYSTAQTDTLFTTDGGRGTGGPQDGGNVTERTTATFGTPLQKKKKGGGREWKNHLCLLQALDFPAHWFWAVKGLPSSILCLGVSTKVVGTLATKEGSCGYARGAEWLWCCGLSALKGAELQHMWGP